MKMFKLWMVVMLLGLLSVVSEAQEDINNAINVQLEYLKKYPKDKDALRKVSFLYLNKADYDQAIFYGRQLFEMGYNERDYNGAVIYSHICLGQAHMMKGNVKEAYSHLGQARLIGESNKNDSEEVTESFSIEDTCKDDEDSGKYSLPIEMYGKMLLILIVLIFVMGRFVKLNYVSISQTKDVIKEELSTELDDVVDSLNDPEKGQEWHLVDKVFLGN